VILFLNQFFDRSTMYLITNEENTNQLNMSFGNLPFMMRISDTNRVVSPQHDQIWGVKLLVWSGGNSSAGNQFHVEYPVEPCNMTKHVSPEYRYLFENINISSYYCADTSNVPMYGIYGDVQPYQFFYYYIYLCENSTTSSNCLDQTTIMNYLTNVYLDVLSIDNSIDSFEPSPNVLYLRSDRHAVSSTMIQSIWMYYHNIAYQTDNGLVLTENNMTSFNQADDNFRYDIDLRNLNSSVIPGTFAGLTVSNSPLKYNYFRSYLKAQNVLANMGGAIKAIMIVSFIVNYLISSKLYNVKIINANDIEAKQNTSMNLVHVSDSQNVTKKIDIKTSITTNDKFSVTTNKQDLPIQLNKLLPTKATMLYKTKLRLNLYELIVPSVWFYNKEKRKRYETSFDRSNTNINVLTIIKKLNELHKIKEHLLGELKYQSDALSSNWDKKQNLISNTLLNLNKKHTKMNDADEGYSLES